MGSVALDDGLTAIYANADYFAEVKKDVMRLQSMYDILEAQLRAGERRMMEFIKSHAAPPPSEGTPAETDVTSACPTARAEGALRVAWDSIDAPAICEEPCGTVTAPFLAASRESSGPEGPLRLGFLPAADSRAVRAASMRHAFLPGIGVVTPQAASREAAPVKTGKPRRRQYGRIGFGPGLNP